MNLTIIAFVFNFIKPKLILNKLFKENFQTEKYCEMNLTRSERSLLAKLRLGALPIRVETGQYNGLERNQRLCMVCNKGNIEDEYHVMFDCQAHEEARNTLINQAVEIMPEFPTVKCNPQN